MLILPHDSVLFQFFLKELGVPRIFLMCFGHNKLLSGDVKNGQVVLRIVLPITYYKILIKKPNS